MNRPKLIRFVTYLVFGTFLCLLICLFNYWFVDELSPPPADSPQSSFDSYAILSERPPPQGAVVGASSPTIDKTDLLLQNPSDSVTVSSGCQVEAPIGPAFCPWFIHQLSLENTFHSSATYCHCLLKSMHSCSLVHRGRTGAGMACTWTAEISDEGNVIYGPNRSTPVIIKRSVLPSRYRFEQDEAAVGCLVSLLRAHRVLDTVMHIYGFARCSPAVIESHLNQSLMVAESMSYMRELSGSTSTFILLELATAPKKREYTEAIVFEVLYTIFAMFHIAHVTISDLWARHLHMHRLPYTRLYSIGNVSCIFPAHTYALKLIDLSIHHHRWMPRVGTVLRSSNFYPMFSRDMFGGAHLTRNAQQMLTWTRQPPFIDLPPDTTAVYALIEFMHTLDNGRYKPPLGDINHARTYRFPENGKEQADIRTAWGDMENYPWYKEVRTPRWPVA